MISSPLGITALNLDRIIHSHAAGCSQLNVNILFLLNIAQTPLMANNSYDIRALYKCVQ